MFHSSLALSTFLAALVALPLTLQQCEGDDDDTPGATPNPMVGDDTTVVVFEGVHQHYGSENTRTVSAQVEFPAEEWLYQTILLHYTLSCPDDGCDPWDRLAYVTAIDEEGGASVLSVEVGRFVTPYGVGGSWTLDVTDLRPILSGTRTIESFIDTWVESGWLVDVSFEFIGGVPERRALEIIPLWSGYYAYGNPDDPIEDHLTPLDIQLPEHFGDAALRVLATGHGQGNTENCAEFCAKTHTLSAGTASDDQVVWRDDCATSGVPGQEGTFWYSRAGWCPGDDVVPRFWELGDTLQAGTITQFDYDLEPYINYESTSSPPYLVITSQLIFFE